MHSLKDKALSAMTGQEMSRLYQARELSPVEVVRDVLDRMEEAEPQIHSMLAIDPEGSLAAARSAERYWMGWQTGDPVKPLCGVPTTVKDTIEIAGMPTTYGSLAFRDNMAPDSHAGVMLRASGAIVVGKANTSEFALSTFCINRLGEATRNPRDLRRTAGGSSGGSSASVAAGLVPFSLGTDSAGSIRIPAAFCGVFGIKPTFGTIPFRQKWRASPTRSHIGVISGTVRDAMASMAALTGNNAFTRIPEDEGALIALVRAARFAFAAEDAGLGPDHGQAVARALGLLGEHGVDVAQAAALPALDVPNQLDDGQPAFSGDHYSAAETLCPNFWELHGDSLTDYAYPLYNAGRSAKAWQYRKVLDLGERYRERMIEWFEPIDFLITPCCSEAPLQPDTIAESGLGPRYPAVTLWNISGNPAVAIPLGCGQDGAPVSIQIVGKHGDDARLLQIAAFFETIAPWGRHNA